MGEEKNQTGSEIILKINISLSYQRAKKDVDKGIIHSDMFLLKKEGKEEQGNIHL